MAKRTIGFSGADLKNFVNLAILHAIKKNRDLAEHLDFDFAYDRILMGIRRPKLLALEEDRRAIAIHEVGHALAAIFREGASNLYKVTILPSGQSLGHTSYVPDKENLNLNKMNILANIEVALGGRAAEELFLGKDNI